MYERTSINAGLMNQRKRGRTSQCARSVHIRTCTSTLQAPLHASQQLNTQSLATMSLREIATSVIEQMGWPEGVPYREGGHALGMHGRARMHSVPLTAQRGLRLDQISSLGASCQSPRENTCTVLMTRAVGLQAPGIARKRLGQGATSHPWRLVRMVVHPSQALAHVALPVFGLRRRRRCSRRRQQGQQSQRQREVLNVSCLLCLPTDGVVMRSCVCLSAVP